MRPLLAILATLAAAPLTAQSTLSIVDTSGTTPTLSDRTVLVARAADGRPLGEKDGPWRVVVEGERLPTRWIRQVSRLVVRKGTDR